MNNIEEATKLARETQFATLGRTIADAHIAHRLASYAIAEAQLRRAQEQSAVSTETRFAGLARQIGDAVSVGKPVDRILDELADLRRRELGAPGK